MIAEIIESVSFEHYRSQFQLLALRSRGGRYSGGGESDLFSFSREGAPNNFFSPFYFLYNAARQSDKKGIKSDSGGTKRLG